MASVNSFEAPDYAVWGLSGALVLIALLSALYALPWRKLCSRHHRQHFEPFNDLWGTKIILEIVLGVWAALQILRLSILWGPNSIVAPPSVTNWTSEGWLCRIYLTTALGIASPLTSWLTLFLLAAASRRVHQTLPPLSLPPTLPMHGSDGDDGHRNSRRIDLIPAAVPNKTRLPPPPPRVLLFAVLCTLPIALLQSAIAWVTQFVDYEQATIESQPRTLIGYFLAVFWHGTPEQCNNNNSTTSSNSSKCTLCTFPAATGIVHIAWTLAFLAALWIVSSKLVASALNRALKRRLRSLVALLTMFSVLGCACVGASVVQGPFTWVNQSLWLGYMATVAATVLLLSWEMVVLPVHTSRVAAASAQQWKGQHSLTHAQKVFVGSGGGGGGGDFNSSFHPSYSSFNGSMAAAAAVAAAPSPMMGVDGTYPSIQLSSYPPHPLLLHGGDRSQSHLNHHQDQNMLLIRSASRASSSRDVIGSGSIPTGIKSPGSFSSSSRRQHFLSGGGDDDDDDGQMSAQDVLLDHNSVYRYQGNEFDSPTGVTSPPPPPSLAPMPPYYSRFNNNNNINNTPFRPESATSSVAGSVYSAPGGGAIGGGGGGYPPSLTIPTASGGGGGGGGAIGGGSLPVLSNSRGGSWGVPAVPPPPPRSGTSSRASTASSSPAAAAVQSVQSGGVLPHSYNGARQYTGAPWSNGLGYGLGLGPLGQGRYYY